MTKRVMAGSVMVMGSFLRICSIHRGTTLPREHRTLPYRVQQIRVFFVVRALATATFSIMALLVPMALTG